MLILKRRLDEEIKIGSDITIKILGVTEGQVKIGIDAPRSVEVYRAEILEKVKESLIEAKLHSKESLLSIAQLKINKVQK